MRWRSVYRITRLGGDFSVLPSIPPAMVMLRMVARAVVLQSASAILSAESVVNVDGPCCGEDTRGSAVYRRYFNMSDSKVKTAAKGASSEETEKRGRGRPRKKTQEASSQVTRSNSPSQEQSNAKEPSGSPTTKRPRGRPKGSTKKGNKETSNSKKSESGKNSGRKKGAKKQEEEEEEGGTAESSEDQ
ncbi:high mobility group protein HMG-I/HMG-Y isoform X2 [Pyxicephalus adspersus]